jgi:hypothetical protein
LAEPEAPPPFGSGTLANEWPVLVGACSESTTCDRINALLRQTVDWPVLLSLAEEHGVIGHLARRIRQIPSGAPEGIQQELQERSRAQILSALAMTAELLRLLEEFRDKSIEVLAIKGPVLSLRAYGDPGLRQYGDLDLLLRSADIESATRLMVKAGYEPQVPLNAIRNRKIPGEYLFRKLSTRILVELHTELSLRYFPRTLPIDEYFQRQSKVAVDGREVPAMAAEDEFVHICVHGTKHLWERLLWIADVAAILARPEKLNWKLVGDSALQVGATRMVHLGMLLAHDVLGARLPAEMEEDIRKDRALEQVVLPIKRRLPFAGFRSPGLWERAGYRMKMRGGGLSGAAYLWRLSVSPTEKDWHEGTAFGSTSRSDVLRRLVRLAKLYGREGK